MLRPAGEIVGRPESEVRPRRPGCRSTDRNHGIGSIYVGAFIVTSLVVGGKLLLLAARTRQLPEFTLGLGLFALVGVSEPAG